MKDYSEFMFSRLPQKYQDILTQEGVYAGYEGNIEKFVSWIFTAFLVLIALESISLSIIGAPLWTSALLVSFLAGVGFSAPYIAFSLPADARKKDINDLLPDFLLLTAANIKSGLTIDRAILFSARPEFGDLAREFKKVAFNIYSGEPIDSAFSKITKRINSDVLERTINLLVEGIKSGGAVAKLLEETALDIRNTETLQKEIRASVMMYVMFIFMAAVLGAPLLFAISTFLISGTMAMWAGMDAPMGTELQSSSIIKISAPSIDSTTFGYFAIAAIVITTTFSGILISLIQSGNARQGIKYSPVFMTVALVIYFAAKEGLMAVFGGMLGI